MNIRWLFDAGHFVAQNYHYTKGKNIMKNYRSVLVLFFGLQLIASNAQAEAGKQATSPEPGVGTVWVEPKSGMEFVWVPSGCFQMGGAVEKEEQPIHKVCLKGFWMGRFEVTQKQYQQVTGENKSIFQGQNNPVDYVNWNDASSFVSKMSAFSGNKIRLPSEAEWEYACSAGGKHKLYCGNGEADKLAWFHDNSTMTTHPGGQLAANDWGLYDMSGNVWEWTQDCYNTHNYKGAPADGSAWKTGNCLMRVSRGGAWNNNPEVLRASHRRFDDAGGRDSINGIRVVRMPQ
jgi:formylglycine-generating enzyme required for sulfatase activity